MSLISRFGENPRGTGANANLDKLVAAKRTSLYWKKSCQLQSQRPRLERAEFGRAARRRRPSAGEAGAWLRDGRFWCVCCGGVGSGFKSASTSWNSPECGRGARSRAAESHRRAAGQEEEDLLANVDSDVSREFPAPWNRWRG